VRVMVTDLSSNLSTMMTKFEGAYNDADTSAPGAFKLTRLKIGSDPTKDVDEFVKAVSEDIKTTLMVRQAAQLPRVDGPDEEGDGSAAAGRAIRTNATAMLCAACAIDAGGLLLRSTGSARAWCQAASTDARAFQGAPRRLLPTCMRPRPHSASSATATRRGLGRPRDKQ